MHADRGEWEGLFAAIDRRDAEAFANFLTPAAAFRFGNSPVITGRANISSAVTTFFGMIEGCRHELTASWTGPDSAVCEGQVTYTLATGASITLPFVNVFETEGGLIRHYRIYIDNSPLFAAIG